MWIDPAIPVERALVTHGHADHARGGHRQVWATPETLAIMALRYGTVGGQPVAYGEGIEAGSVKISFHPAGHVLGSAQICLEHAGERVVVTAHSDHVLIARLGEQPFTTRLVKKFALPVNGWRRRSDA